MRRELPQAMAVSARHARLAAGMDRTPSYRAGVEQWSRERTKVGDDPRFK